VAKENCGTMDKGGSPRLPKQAVSNVKSGDGIRQATERANSSKNKS
jgi:hypothetical protein